MNLLKSKTSCVAIGFNIVFYIALYIYVALRYQVIYIIPSVPHEDVARNIIFLYVALISPLVISIGFSILALYDKKIKKLIIISNMIFSIIFLIIIGRWYGMFICLFT
ncbi:hypothetical protein [Bacillus cereus]|uniref:hypothetical protein n=1 Tax=Bacillus cereus TaxID=1396 RepID=UPI0018CF0E91|nr:hypothetical protein [Bacillus cereus]MBG9616678.1 hypothetical protein [Bacillus cereus]